MQEHLPFDIRLACNTAQPRALSVRLSFRRIGASCSIHLQPYHYVRRITSADSSPAQPKSSPALVETEVSCPSRHFELLDQANRQDGCASSHGSLLRQSLVRRYPEWRRPWPDVLSTLVERLGPRVRSPFARVARGQRREGLPWMDPPIVATWVTLVMGRESPQKDDPFVSVGRHRWC